MLSYADHIAQFLKLVFLGVAVCPLGPRKDECQLRMATLEEPTIAKLGNIVADVPGWAMLGGSSITESPSTREGHQDHMSVPPTPTVDSDLLHEALAAELRAENNSLKHEVQGLRQVHQEDQNKYSWLQENYVCISRLPAKKMLT